MVFLIIPTVGIHERHRFYPYCDWFFIENQDVFHQFVDISASWRRSLLHTAPFCHRIVTPCTFITKYRLSLSCPALMTCVMLPVWFVFIIYQLLAAFAYYLSLFLFCYLTCLLPCIVCCRNRREHQQWKGKGWYACVLIRSVMSVPMGSFVVGAAVSLSTSDMDVT